MTGRSRKPKLALGAMMLAGAASAGLPPAAFAAGEAPPAPAPMAGNPQATLENKLRLVKLLLSQSPAVRRIPQSGNAAAQKKLADAQALYAKAAGDAAGGRIDPAIKALDQALLEIVAAARMVPDAAQLAEQERHRYTGLKEGIRTFLKLHRKLSASMATRNAPPPANALNLARIDAAVDEAESLAAAGRHKEANAMLDGAYKDVVAAINRMLMSATIVYDRKFESPAEEFEYELARNLSYEELVPLALVQMNPARETALLSERYVQQSRKLRASAQQQAADGDHRAALKTIQDATGELLRSLRIAGVVLPQAEDSKP